MTEITKKILASGQTLTNSYAITSTEGVLETRKVSQITIYRIYAPGTAETSNTMDLVVETSTDNSNWHQEGVIDDTTPTACVDAPMTFRSDSKDAGQTYTGAPIRMPIDAHYTRIRVKENGVAANYGTATVVVELRYV